MNNSFQLSGELGEYKSLPDKIARRWSVLRFSQRSFPIAAFILCILAYGFILPRLGFYWDDWPWIWMSHVFGPQGMLKIDQGYRPFSGEILWLGGILAGKSPLLWQIFNLVLRWLSGLALWWALGFILPRHREKAVWIALIFLVYPGFRQQFVAVNSSRHILPLVFFFLSIGFMVWAIREKRRSWIFTGAALGLQLLSMLSTEYYYGLELIRPVILGLALQPEKSGWASWLKRLMKCWGPFLALFIILVVWRYWISPQGNYPIVIMGDIANQPLSFTLDTGHRIVQDSLTAGLVAWTNLFEFARLSQLGPRHTLYYWALIVGSIFFILVYLIKLCRDQISNGFWKTALGLGIYSIIVAGVPFLVTAIGVGLRFPSDRTTLPMAFGACLLLVGVIDLIGRKRLVKIILVSLTIGLSVGVHYLSALSFEKDWDIQSSFYRQLSWRVPGLKPGAAVIYEYTTALQDTYFTDNSLVAPLNWIYFPENSGMQIPLYVIDLRLRGNEILPMLQKNLPVSKDYGKFDFLGQAGDVLMVQFAPPGCLQVLPPQYAGLYPHLPDNLAHSVPFSNPDVIIVNPGRTAGLPTQILNPQAELDWCYYFERADLARQLGDWNAVVELGDRAFDLVDYPKAPSERLPFIQAYGITGRWQRAEELTFETIRLDINMQPLLCSVWLDLAQNTPESPSKQEALSRVMAKLNCQDK